MWRHVVLSVLCLAGCALASRQLIESQMCVIGELPPGESGSLTYYYPEELNSPGTVNCSVAETVRCHQSVNSARLQGRSWYISQDKAYFGQGYNPRFFQHFNLECPVGHYLNLAFQGNVEFICEGGTDTVRVNTSRGDTGPLCTDVEAANSYLSLGKQAGVILEDARAKIEFCSNLQDMAKGFYIRGTCINPVQFYNQPGCVSYDFFLAWDPLFVTIVDDIFAMPQTTEVPHKRSVKEEKSSFDRINKKVEELMKLADVEKKFIENVKKNDIKGRNKRIARTFFEFAEGTEVTYLNNMLRFLFPDGTVESYPVYCLSAFNELYGTRIYRHNATRQIGDQTRATEITFTGEGFVDIFPTSDRTSINAYLTWTPPMPFEDFLENDGITQKTVASRIYDYIVEFWASAFVVQDNILAESLDPKPFPMSSGPGQRFFPTSVRTRTDVGIVFPEVQPGSICEETVRFDTAPLRRARIDRDLLEFCSFFQYACEPVLATACRELLELDPFDVHPDTRARMNMMGGGD